MNVFRLGYDEVAEATGKTAAHCRRLAHRAEVVRFLAGLQRKYADAFEQRRAETNGEPGLLFTEGGAVRYAWSFHVERGRTRSIFVVANPDKLGEVEGAF